MNIAEVAEEAYSNAVDHGFRDDVDPNNPRQTATELMLITSELAEALEEIRSRPGFYGVLYFDNNKPSGFGIELADAIIRILDTARARNIDIEAMLREKMAYNRTRPHLHGGKAL